MRLKRQEIDQLEADLVSLDDEDVQEEDEDEDLFTMVTRILAHFSLEKHAALFFRDGDGIAVLANCCNAAAKLHDAEFYALKPVLIRLATARGTTAWQHEGIVYIETRVGQFSFHALYGEDEGLPPANGRVWNELPYQMNAGMVAQAYIEEWSLSTLLEKLTDIKKQNPERF